MVNSSQEFNDWLYMKRLYFLLLFHVMVFAGEYRLGHGYEIAPWLKVGGYISAEYQKRDYDNEFEVDDIAFLGYGDIPGGIQYLLEMEAVKYYVHDFENETSENNSRFYVERAYLSYAHNQYLTLTAGKFITPGCYWNQVPINVLRDTTSKPMLSQYLFPRLVSGAGIEGYIPGTESSRYALFIQKNRDIDHGYNNFYTQDHTGAMLKQELDEWEVALWGGNFEDVDKTRNMYAGLSIQYKDEENTLQIEGAYGKADMETSPIEKEREGIYAQYTRQLARQHYVVGRYEYFRDEAMGSLENIYILGYNYRPIFPVSLKAEYQHHPQLPEENGVLFSFSVLF